MISLKSFLRIQRRQVISLFKIRSFGTSNNIKRYFMVRYNYGADGYYRRLGEIKKHEKAMETLKNKFSTVVICSHFFPYTGRLYLFETNADLAEIESHVNSDPYIKNGKIQQFFLKVCNIKSIVVSDFEIKEFDIESVRKFSSVASEFLQRY